MPIINNILGKITKNEPVDLDKLNIDKAFKVARAGFLRLRKITYISTKLKKALFSNTKVIRSYVLFSNENQYAMFFLKQSKIDTKHTGARIIFAATSKKTCLVAALSCFYTLDS